MKKILFILLCLFSLTDIQAQSDSVIKNRTAELLKKPEREPARDPVYCCRKCNYTSPKPGTCPVDKTILIKEGKYFCPVDGTLSDVDGKCPKCGRKMKRMEMPTHEG